MSIRHQEHAHFLDHVMDQVDEMMEGSIRKLTIHTPPGIGTLGKIVTRMDHRMFGNQVVRRAVITQQFAFDPDLELNFRSFRVVVIDEWDLLSPALKERMEWALYRYQGGVIRIFQIPRGMLVGKIAVA